MKTVAIFGASGFVGSELLRLLALHPVFEPVRLFADSKVDARLADVHPHLAADYGGLAFERYSPALLGNVDLVFAALPHGRSQEIARDVLDSGAAFVDLGADFRLDSADDYARWYKEAHSAPELLSQFIYGIPEINREAIRSARAVAAAGCYPTSAILALRPLIDLIEPGTVTVDAASGVSGAGKGLKEETHFNTVDENLTAYGLLSHRHTAEMEMVLKTTLLFTPHLAPMNRGILATCTGVAARPFDPLAVLRDAYRDEPFVCVSERPPSTKWALGSNVVHLTARYDERTNRVLALAAMDNLVKGAAGQMIQCANLMLGLDEGAGLPRAGMWP
jgi:N-acetyl-gamma-glutamyl-phosphate reductase